MGGRRSLALAVAALALASGLPATASAAHRGDAPSGPPPGFVEHHGSGGEIDVNVCSYAVPPRAAHCDARVRTDSAAASARPARREGTPQAGIGNNGAYDPAFLQSAYNVASAAAADGGGAGQIVAIVDAYDDPNVASDLAQYRSFFGLAACQPGTVSPTATGCVFEKVNETGAAGPYPSADTGWAAEISLDVDMVSAICPKCQILLVEANTNLLDDLGAGVDEAVRLGADVVSNSYGGPEFSGETSYDSSYYAHQGVAVVVSSGDNGYGVQYPAASPFVTAVGGTSLTELSATGTRDGSETAWSGAGAGCSSYEPKPSWQRDGGCANRAVADVSAVADPNTGVWIYDSYGASGWEIYGGTSASAPIVGAFYALGGAQHGTADTFASYPYGAAGALYDAVSGSDGVCSPAYLCTAGTGYDGPTGLGTPGGTPNSVAAFRPQGSNSGSPTITSFAPSSGQPGTSVRVNGSGFAGTTAVAFNGTGATFSVNSGTSLNATVPAGATSGPITVTTPSGTASSSTFTVTASEPGSAGTYQIDVAHDGVQRAAPPAPPFTRLWTAALPATPSYPLIAAGKVFVTVPTPIAPSPYYGTTLYALDQRTGQLVWSQPIAGSYMISGAAYDAGQVFVVNHDGLVRAFAAATGAQAWQVQLSQSSFTSPPVAANGVVYIGGAGSGGTVYAIDELTGGLLGTQPVMNGDDSSPALSGTGVFVSYACNQAYAFAPTTLAPVWHHSSSCEGGGGKTTVYANGRVYTRDFNGNLVLDAGTGAELGSWTAAGTTGRAPAVDGSSLFALTWPTSGGTTALGAQSLADGSTRWSFTGDGQLVTAPIVLSAPSGEFVVEGSSSGMLYALDAASGATVWSANVGAAIPGPDEQNATVLSGLSAGQGLLLVPAGNGLVAYGAAAAPSAPPNVAASAGDGQVSLTWSAPTSGSGPFTYSVYRGNAPGAEAATPIASGLTTTSYLDAGLSNGTTYYYEVKAANAVGPSGFSNEASATPKAAATVPGVPTNVRATPGQTKGVVLTWAPPTSNGGSTITAYTVYRGTSPGGEAAYVSVACTTTTCSYADTATKKKATYWYQVAAVNSIGTGARSSEVSAVSR